MAFNKEKVMDAARKFVDQRSDRQSREGVPADRQRGSEGRPRLAEDRRPLREEGRQAGSDRHLPQGRALLSRARLPRQSGRGLQADPQARSAARRRDPQARRALSPARAARRRDAALRIRRGALPPRGQHQGSAGHRRAARRSRPREHRDADQARRAVLEGGHARGGRDGVHPRVRSTAPPGPPGRLREGRRAPAVAQARQPRPQPRARRALPPA